MDAGAHYLAENPSDASDIYRYVDKFMEVVPPPHMNYCALPVLMAQPKH
jgi:hypothetical protein